MKITARLKCLPQSLGDKNCIKELYKNHLKKFVIKLCGFLHTRRKRLSMLL